MATKEQLLAVIRVMETVAEAIAEAGQDGIPSGVLYAMLMEKGMSLDSYQHMISLLIQAGRVRLSNHVLYKA